MRKKIYYCYIVFGSIWLQRYCKENYMRKKHVMVRLYLSQYDCVGIAKKIIWGKTYHVFVSILSRFCKSQRVSLMREQVANWFNFSRHNAIFLSKLQTVFAILNILQSVLGNNFYDICKRTRFDICLLTFTFTNQVEHFKKDLERFVISNWMWMHCRWQF